VKHQKVMLGYLHPGHEQHCFAASLRELMFYDAAHGQHIVSHAYGVAPKETGAAHINAGRNTLASMLLNQQEAGWLLMIDADMGFAPDTVERLLDAADAIDRPIVGGLAFAQKSDGIGAMYARRYRMCPTIYRMYETETEVGFVPVFDYPRDQLVEVDATGAACILIHRSVLEKITRESPGRPFDQVSIAKGSTGRTDFGEDLSFCIRARAAGASIHVDTSVKTTHDKGAVFLDEETYDLQQAMMALRGLAA
jgi:GT2 family glycosyltransferase